ncbi:MAG TPA: hypothetical protein VMU22_13315 [Rhizomicrobium sp.]|nr:hypothetical protein [Rhizomicrobium sp.]
MFGRWLGSLRGKRPENVIRYENDFMSVAVLSLTMAAGFAVVWLLRVKGWEDGGSLALAAFMVGIALFFALLTFRFSIVIGPEDIALKHVLRPGWTRVKWASIRSWRVGRRGSVVFALEPKGRLELRWVFKDGFEALLEAVDARGIPEAT